MIQAVATLSGIDDLWVPERNDVLLEIRSRLFLVCRKLSLSGRPGDWGSSFRPLSERDKLSEDVRYLKWRRKDKAVLVDFSYSRPLL